MSVEYAKVQDGEFFGRSFDAAVAVVLLFLLPEKDQFALIERVAKIVVPGGRFLFTAPIETGSWIDLNAGITCQSLGRARYETCLNSVGFRIAATFADKGENNYYDTERAD